MAKKKETAESVDTEIVDTEAVIDDVATDDEIDQEVPAVEEPADEVLREPVDVAKETPKVDNKDTELGYQPKVLEYAHPNISIYITPDKGVLVARATHVTLTGVAVGKFAQCTYRWGKVIRCGYTFITPEIKSLLM